MEIKKIISKALAKELKKQETNNTSTGTQNYSGGSNQTTSETKEPIIQKKNDWTFNPNEPDSDKRYNAKEHNQLKTEKTLFSNTEESRYGIINETGVYSFRNKY